MTRIKKPGTILIILGIALIAAGLLLTMWNTKEQYRVAEDTEEIMQKIAPVITQHQSSAASNPEEAILDALMDFPVVEIDGVAYLGVLVIPDLNLELPVRYEWSYESLRDAPCRYSGSVAGNNLVICAHNYSAHFGNLKQLEPGAPIYLVDMNGNIKNYIVALVETLEPTELERMRESEYALSLFTCTIGGATRVTVRCQPA